MIYQSSIHLKLKKMKKMNVFFITLLLFVIGGCTRSFSDCALVKYSNGEIDTIYVSEYCGSIKMEDYPENKEIFVRVVGVNQKGGGREHKEIVSTYDKNIAYGYFVSIREAKLLYFFKLTKAKAKIKVAVKVSIPKENQPREGEMFLGNISTQTYLTHSSFFGVSIPMRDARALERNFSEIGYCIKRHGHVDYDKNREPIQSQVPVFVSKTEYDSVQAEYKKQKLTN